MALSPPSLIARIFGCKTSLLGVRDRYRAAADTPHITKLVLSAFVARFLP